MAIGINLKTLLRDRGVTIKQLSEMSGISANTLYSITKRDPTRIDRLTLERICSTLNIAADELTGQSTEWPNDDFSWVDSLNDKTRFLCCSLEIDPTEGTAYLDFPDYSLELGLEDMEELRTLSKGIDQYVRFRLQEIREKNWGSLRRKPRA